MEDFVVSHLVLAALDEVKAGEPLLLLGLELADLVHDSGDLGPDLFAGLVVRLGGGALLRVFLPDGHEGLKGLLLDVFHGNPATSKASQKRPAALESDSSMLT